MARRKDGLYRRENDILTFKYKDENDCWKEKYTRTRDRDEAIKFRNDFLKDLADGALPTEMGGWRLSEAVKWWNACRKPSV